MGPPDQVHETRKRGWHFGTTTYSHSVKGRRRKYSIGEQKKKKKKKYEYNKIVFVPDGNRLEMTGWF